MTQFAPEQYSSRYKLALTIAIFLFLATLTASILIGILANASHRSLEEDYQWTLTAIHNEAAQAQTTVVWTPTFAPPLIAGVYPFAPRANSPTYRAAKTCELQLVSGLVLDQGGKPLDGFQVQVWGDFVDGRQLARSGFSPDIVPGQWEIALPGVINRRVWVQVAIDQDHNHARYLSPPVEVVFGQGDCDHNQAEIVFKQVGPLE